MFTMRKQRLREGKWHAWGHTANKQLKPRLTPYPKLYTSTAKEWEKAALPLSLSGTKGWPWVSKRPRWPHHPQCQQDCDAAGWLGTLCLVGAHSDPLKKQSQILDNFVTTVLTVSGRLRDQGSASVPLQPQVRLRGGVGPRGRQARLAPVIDGPGLALSHTYVHILPIVVCPCLYMLYDETYSYFL